MWQQRQAERMQARDEMPRHTTYGGYDAQSGRHAYIRSGDGAVTFGSPINNTGLGVGDRVHLAQGASVTRIEGANYRQQRIEQERRGAPPRLRWFTYVEGGAVFDVNGNTVRLNLADTIACGGTSNLATTPQVGLAIGILEIPRGSKAIGMTLDALVSQTTTPGSINNGRPYTFRAFKINGLPITNRETYQAFIENRVSGIPWHRPDAWDAAVVDTPSATSLFSVNGRYTTSIDPTFYNIANVRTFTFWSILQVGADWEITASFTQAFDDRSWGLTPGSYCGGTVITTAEYSPTQSRLQTSSPLTLTDATPFNKRQRLQSGKYLLQIYYSVGDRTVPLVDNFTLDFFVASPSPGFTPSIGATLPYDPIAAFPFPPPSITLPPGYTWSTAGGHAQVGGEMGYVYIAEGTFVSPVQGSTQNLQGNYFETEVTLQ